MRSRRWSRDDFDDSNGRVHDSRSSVAVVLFVGERHAAAQCEDGRTNQRGQKRAFHGSISQKRRFVVFLLYPVKATARRAVTPGSRRRGHSARLTLVARMTIC